jgi:hypothetical protein
LAEHFGANATLTKLVAEELLSAVAPVPEIPEQNCWAVDAAFAGDTEPIAAAARTEERITFFIINLLSIF